ncbi:MAG: hypothetical protein WCJ57_00610 [Candidatus Falkowbacteria bacterium]
MKKTRMFLMILVVIAIAATSCKKYEKDEIVPDSPNNPVNTVSPFFLKVGNLKYANGDNIWCVPGVQNIFYIFAPTPGSYYTWNFCGTILTGSATNLQTNVSHLFATSDTCTVTITEMPANTSITVTVYAANTNPLVPPLYFLGSTQNTDGTYTYNWGVRKDRISDVTGTMFQIGDHTAWAMSYANISTTVPDSLIRFNFRAYNQMLKFNAGRGTTFSDVTGSIWAALAWPADNNYQMFLEDGVPQLATYSPTIVSPGLVGDNAGPFRATITATDIALFFQVSNFVTGAKDSPYCNYKIGNGTWSGNIPMTWFNGYGWAQAPLIPVSLIPPGGIIVSIVYGATGGQAAMATSAYYVPSAGCLQFQITMVNKSFGGGYQISPVK